MGATVSARWATGDDDAVVIVVSSLSLHRCRECKGRAGQSSHDNGVMITTERLSRRRRHCIAVASAREGRARARCASGHDDDATIATARSSHRCRHHVAVGSVRERAGRGQV